MGRMLRMFPGVCAPAMAALLMATLMLMAPLASGQVAATQPETVVDILHQVSDKADVIFAGQVVAIRRTNEGVVEVEFRVDQAIRGCTAGTSYILREWAGLWAGDIERYRVGQSLLMLLHAPSAAGMSSPVSGLDGAIPIRQGGVATPLADAATPPQPPFVDLRWLGAKLPHAVSYSNEPTHTAKTNDVTGPFVAQQQAQEQVQAAAAGLIMGAAPVTLMVGSSSRVEASVPAQQASVDAVISMLTTWQKAQHAAP
jgi:hypothetical protein